MVDCKTSYTTYINHSRHLIPDGIHRHEGMREELGISSLMLSAKQEIRWYHFVFGMTRSGIEPATSRSQGGRSTTRQLGRFFFFLRLKKIINNIFFSRGLHLNIHSMAKSWEVMG